MAKAKSMPAGSGHRGGGRAPEAQRSALLEGERQRMIAEAAYYRALERGFQGGDPVQDWLAAERDIDHELQRPERVTH